MKKLKLKDLQLESFVTNSQEKLGRTIRGGSWVSSFDYDYHQNCGGSDSCYEPYTDRCPTVDCSGTINC